jgi:hypothetical protein
MKRERVSERDDDDDEWMNDWKEIPVLSLARLSLSVLSSCAIVLAASLALFFSSIALSLSLLDRERERERESTSRVSVSIVSFARRSDTWEITSKRERERERMREIDR